MRDDVAAPVSPTGPVRSVGPPFTLPAAASTARGPASSRPTVLQTGHHRPAALLSPASEEPSTGARGEDRSLDTRCCPDCNLMCCKLSLGGLCPRCDEPVLLIELSD